jgi:hypothetical protein
MSPDDSQRRSLMLPPVEGRVGTVAVLGADGSDVPTALVAVTVKV